MYVQNAKCVLGQILRLKSLDVKPIRLSAKGALFCGKKKSFIYPVQSNHLNFDSDTFGRS